MTDELETEEGPESGAMKALLSTIKAATRDEPAPRADFVAGVHRSIRKRSRGRFFADGWSTSSTRVNYALVAVVMLVIVIVVYAALGPVGVSTP